MKTKLKFFFSLLWVLCICEIQTETESLSRDWGNVLPWFVARVRFDPSFDLGSKYLSWLQQQQQEQSVVSVLDSWANSFTRQKWEILSPLWHLLSKIRERETVKIWIQANRQEGEWKYAYVEINQCKVAHLVANYLRIKRNCHKPRLSNLPQWWRTVCLID